MARPSISPEWEGQWDYFAENEPLGPSLYKRGKSKLPHIGDRLKGIFEPQVNNALALHIYGSATNITTAQQEMRNQKNFQIHPASDFRQYWDLLMVWLIFANLLLLPLSIAFFPDENIGWHIFYVICDLLFMTDVVFNFFTGYIVEESVVMKREKIIRRYLKGWFWIDLISSLPLEIIYLITESALANREDEAASELLNVGGGVLRKRNE